MAGKTVIRVKDLYKVYRVGDSKVKALNGVDFTTRKTDKGTDRDRGRTYRKEK